MLNRGRGSQRLLTTVLFTDIVGSTERAAALGDRGWKDLVARHHAIVRRELRRFHGRELDTAGDGFFASFDRPAQAIECATAIIDDLRPLDLRIRAAIHMGEAEVMGGKVGGITVHVASRALGHAGAGEILVTSTVREVTVGADVAFDDRGVHEFKGVPGEWHLYAVEWQRRELSARVLAGAADSGADATARRRPGWRTTAGAAAVAAVLMGAAAWVLLARGPGASPPVPRPNSVVRVDAATNTVVAVVDAGDTPTGIAIGDDTVWVLSQRRGLLTGFPAAGGAPSPIGLGAPPTGIAAGGGSVWIALGYTAAGESKGVVLRVSAGTHRPEETIPLGNGVNAVALDASAVWVTNGAANTLTKIDVATRSVVKSVPVTDEPVAVVVGGGAVWVANGVSKTIWRLDPVTLAKTDEIPLRDAPTAMALGFGRLWVASNVGSTVTVFDAGTTGRVATIPLDQAPQGIAAGADSIWVAGRSALLRIDRGSLSVASSIALPGPAWGVAASGGSVWVTVQP